MSAGRRWRKGGTQIDHGMTAINKWEQNGAVSSRHVVITQTTMSADTPQPKVVGYSTYNNNNDTLKTSDRGCTTNDDPCNDWVHLTEKKEYSRLLYTNPLCFLCTTTNDNNNSPSPTTTNGEDVAMAPPSSSPPNNDHQALKRPNVMVVTWLTATNNEGRFMMSINRHRHTAQSFFDPLVKVSNNDDANRGGNSTDNGVCFTLCVPVKGMEELIQNIGSTSGRFGNKFTFQQQRQDEIETHSPALSTAATTTTTINNINQLSKRQQKKLKRQKFSSCGIPGLRAIPFGGSTTSGSGTNSGCSRSIQNQLLLTNDATTRTATTDSADCFVIDGTVAHLKCRVVPNLPSSSSSSSSQVASQSAELLMLDKNHYLVVGEIVDAYVKKSYWDSSKKLFRPMASTSSCNNQKTQSPPPYLTFFGSQTFGFIVNSE